MDNPHLVKTGDVFQRLTVLGFSHKDKRSRRHYRVRCECGTIKTVQGTLMRTGNTKSCGCWSREIAGTRNKIPNNGAIVNFLILQYKRHARDRGIEFLLKREEVDWLVRQPCHYCGIDAGNITRIKNCRQGFRYNGIDRVDSRQPYTSGNVVPCCGLCNKAKRDMPRDVFIAWAIRVARHQEAFAAQWSSL